MSAPRKEIEFLFSEVLGHLSDTTEESAEYEAADARERQKIRKGVLKYQKHCLARLNRILDEMTADTSRRPT